MYISLFVKLKHVYKRCIIFSLNLKNNMNKNNKYLQKINKYKKSI